MLLRKNEPQDLGITLSTLCDLSWMLPSKNPATDSIEVDAFLESGGKRAFDAPQAVYGDLDLVDNPGRPRSERGTVLPCKTSALRIQVGEGCLSFSNAQGRASRSSDPTRLTTLLKSSLYRSTRGFV